MAMHDANNALYTFDSTFNANMVTAREWIEQYHKYVEQFGADSAKVIDYGQKLDESFTRVFGQELPGELAFSFGDQMKKIRGESEQTREQVEKDTQAIADSLKKKRDYLNDPYLKAGDNVKDFIDATGKNPYLQPGDNVKDFVNKNNPAGTTQSPYLKVGDNVADIIAAQKKRLDELKFKTHLNRPDTGPVSTGGKKYGTTQTQTYGNTPAEQYAKNSRTPTPSNAAKYQTVGASGGTAQNQLTQALADSAYSYALYRMGKASHAARQQSNLPTWSKEDRARAKRGQAQAATLRSAAFQWGNKSRQIAIIADMFGLKQPKATGFGSAKSGRARASKAGTDYNTFFLTVQKMGFTIDKENISIYDLSKQINLRNSYAQQQRQKQYKQLQTQHASFTDITDLTDIGLTYDSAMSLEEEFGGGQTAIDDTLAKLQAKAQEEIKQLQKSLLELEAKEKAREIEQARIKKITENNKKYLDSGWNIVNLMVRDGITWAKLQEMFTADNGIDSEEARILEIAQIGQRTITQQVST